MLTVFSPVVVKNVMDFEHAIAQVRDFELRDGHILAIRVGIDLWRELIDINKFDNLDAIISDIKNRLPEFDVLIFPDGGTLFSSCNIDINLCVYPRYLVSKNDPVKFMQPAECSYVNALCRQDLSNIFNLNLQAMTISATENYHFVLPSGVHTDKFIRLSEAFRSVDIVDRLAYWITLKLLPTRPILLPQNEECLIFDHFSMLILGARAQKIFNCEIHCFQEYPGSKIGKKRLFLFLDELSAKFSRINVVLGVISSGGLIKKIKEWASSKSVSVNIIILYSVAGIDNDDVMCLFDLQSESFYEDEKKCRYCKEDSSKVYIDGATYLVNHKISEVVKLPVSYFDSQKDFIERYGAEPGVLKTHYDDPNESNSRHHAFYIDVECLMQIDDFVSRVDKYLLDLSPRPDLIVAPRHLLAMKIGRRFSTLLDCDFVPIDAPFGDSISEFKDVFRKAINILVVDDLFISGNRLGIYNKEFRENSELFPNLSQIYFFTPIATPSSMREYEKKCNSIILKHKIPRKIDHVYTIVLPPWSSGDHCPWCKELDVLLEIAKNGDIFESTVEERIAALSDNKLGLQSNSFFRGGAVGELPVLGGESAVLKVGSSALQVLFSVASAFQQLRTSEKNSLAPSAFPVPKYLDKQVFDNYSEHLIWLAILKSVRSNELSVEAKKHILNEFELLGNALVPCCCLPEMAISVMLNKLGDVDDAIKLKLAFEKVGFSWEQILASDTL